MLNCQAHFGINNVINPGALCAFELAKEIRSNNCTTVERFSNGLIEAQRIAVSASPTLVGKSLQEIRFTPEVGIGRIYRGGHYEFATSETRIMAGDLVTIFGPSQSLNSERQRRAPERYQNAQSVTIFGGGETTIALARDTTFPKILPPHYRERSGDLSNTCGTFSVCNGYSWLCYFRQIFFVKNRSAP